MICNQPVCARSVHYFSYVLRAVRVALAGVSVVIVPSLAGAQAVCPVTPVASGLQSPLSIVLTPLGNLLVAESGGRPSNTGRISIIGLDGQRRTLLTGLPSGINDVGEPSGPAGLFMRGRTLFALIGIGDAILNAAVPGTHVANPHPSSALFSSVLAIHFSGHVEQTTTGFALSLADQQVLAGGGKVTLSNDDAEGITIELVTNFADTTPLPTAALPEGVRGSNPFGLVAVGNQLYVSDGGQNELRQVDLTTGAYFTVAAFPTVPNPLPIGPPLVEAVPTGIAFSGGRLLVALFSGVPFAPGTSSVVQVDPSTGSVSPLTGELTTAIGILPVKQQGTPGYLVLQTSSGPGPFFSGPGLLLRTDASGAIQREIAGCLQAPTAMALDAMTDTLYVTGLTGAIVAIVVD
jgi:hypothetical protein